MKTTLSGMQDHTVKQSTSSCKLAAPPGELATLLTTTSNTNRDKHMELLQVLELIYVKASEFGEAEGRCLGRNKTGV